MNLIKCARNCEYQLDGYCCRDESGEVKNPFGGCPYFETKNPLHSFEQSGSADIYLNKERY
jgi:hypothetical protein